jgi:hypothetical protein
MKKFVLILLIGIYSLATMGFSLKQFYCCGKLKSITISLTPDANWTCSKGIEKRGCCDNKYQFFKVKDSHITAEQVNNPVKWFTDIYLCAPSFQEIVFISEKTLIFYRSNAPPLHTGVPLYIYNCFFRI